MKIHHPHRQVANQCWSVELNNGSVSVSDAQLLVLMDIRAELQKLNRVIGCQNFLDIPRTLKGIQRKLPVRRKRKPPQ